MDDTETFDDAEFSEAFMRLHHNLPRQGPGSDALTAHMLELAGPLPAHPRVLDLGCGPGRSALLLASTIGARVTAVDLYQPFLDELAAEVDRRGLADSIEILNASMEDLPFPDSSVDVIWAEGSAYNIGFDNALKIWRGLLRPGGVLVVTECEWDTDTPSQRTRDFWDASYPAMRDTQSNTATAREAGYTILAVVPVPDDDWIDEYYTSLAARLEVMDTSDPVMAKVVAITREEIALRHAHPDEYRYTGYVLRRD